MNLKLTPVAEDASPLSPVSRQSPVIAVKPRSTRHEHLHKKLDTVGMCASILCAIHCFVAPFVLILNPIFSWIQFSRKMDIVFLSVAAAVGLTGCLLSIRQHKIYTSLWLMLSGLILNGIGRFGVDVLGPFLAMTLILAGPLFMSYALWMDRQLCRCNQNES